MNHNHLVGNRYEIIQELGKNSWSSTYLAKDIMIPASAYCVVQQFPLTETKATAIRADVQKRFANETFIWQKLSLELEIPYILACFEENDRLYLVREYIAGKNLAQLLQDGLLKEAEVIRLLRDVLNTLSLIHQQEVIHHNLKPSNLIVREDDGRTLVIGFSDIKPISDRPVVLESANELTSLTNEYYPPLTDAPTTPSRDIYALGAIAIEAVTGLKPSQIPSLSPKTLLAREASQLDYRLVEILERMMSLKSAKGYTSADKVLEDLDKIESNSVPTKADSIEPTNISQPLDLKKDNSNYPDKKSFNRRSLAFLILGGLFLIGVGELLLPSLRPRYYCYRGRTSLADEQLKAALNNFQQAVDLNSQSVCGWLGEAQVFYGLERYRAALAAYDNVERIRPNLIETWQGRGEVLYRLERFEAANTAYNKTLRMQPDNAVVWNRQGKALYKLELYREALAAQDKALELQPDYVPALSDRGIALIGMGQYQEALETFDRAQAIDPLDPTLWQNKALVLQYLNRPQESIRLYQEALEAYEKVIQDHPENITALLDRAYVLSQLQRHQEALTTYEQALAVNEDSHLAWLGKGNALFALRQYPEALAAFNRTVKVQPNSYISWHNRGSLLRDGLRNLPEAIASYDRSLEINPNFYHGWRDRGIALSQNGQQKEAIESFKKALSIKPNDHQSWVGRGIALSSLGKTDEAISVFDRAVEIQPKDPFVWMNRGLVLEAGNRNAEACNSYREVKKINPGFSPAIQKLQQLGCS